MNIQAPENQERIDGPWLQFWNDANDVSLSTARIAFGQLQLAALAGRFVTQRMRAYAEADGHTESAVQRLGQITAQFREDYAKQLGEIYSSIGKVGATLNVPTPDAANSPDTDRSQAAPAEVPARRSPRVAARAKSPTAKRARGAVKARQSRERRPKRKRNSSM